MGSGGWISTGQNAPLSANLLRFSHYLVLSYLYVISYVLKNKPVLLFKQVLTVMG